jgi:hypothetical protein
MAAAASRAPTTCAALAALIMAALLAGGALALPLPVPLPLPPPPLPIMPLAQLDPKLLAAGGLVSLAAKCVGPRSGLPYLLSQLCQPAHSPSPTPRSRLPASCRGGPAIALTQPVWGALQGDLLALFTKAAVKFTAFDIEKAFVVKFLTDRWVPAAASALCARAAAGRRPGGADDS